MWKNDAPAFISWLSVTALTALAVMCVVALVACFFLAHRHSKNAEPLPAWDKPSKRIILSYIPYAVGLGAIVIALNFMVQFAFSSKARDTPAVGSMALAAPEQLR